MSDPWQEMEDWCAERSRRLAEKAGKHVMGGGPLGSPGYRTVLGKSQAYAEMRSFIHGARNA